jgi:hypothetical protein
MAAYAGSAGSVDHHALGLAARLLCYAAAIGALIPWAWRTHPTVWRPPRDRGRARPGSPR